MGYLPSQSRKRKKSRTRSFGRNWVTSLRDFSTSEGAARLRERIWCSSRWMMDMDRVCPIAGGVEEDPVLHAVPLHQEAEMVAGHELPIDGPLPIQAVELEGAGDPGGHVRARQLVEGRIACRIHAVVRDAGAGHSELQ